METNNQPVSSKYPVPPPPNYQTSSKQLSPTIFIIVAVLFLIVAGLGALTLAGYINFPKSQLGTSSPPTSSFGNLTTTSIPSRAQDTSISGKPFFISSVPKPISALKIQDLPNSETTSGSASYKDLVFLSSSGFIIEYNQDLKLVGYSDPQKYRCYGSIAIKDAYLFAACGTVNGLDLKRTPLISTELYKINIINNSVDRIFTQSDGLLNEQNLDLAVGGNYLWVGTGNGVGLVDLSTNEVKFYTNELGIGGTDRGTSYEVTGILADGRYIWVSVAANSVSKGGLTVFDSETQKWRSFGPETFLIHGLSSRVDIAPHALKTVDGGIDVGLDDCTIGRYQYATAAWSTRKLPVPCNDYVNSYFPFPWNSVNQDKINGRSNISLSPMINGKRYILTSSTIDTIDENTAFPQTVFKLGRNINSGNVATALLIDPESLLGVIIAATTPYDCFATKCSGLDVWLLNLKSNMLIKQYESVLERLPISLIDDSMEQIDVSEKLILNKQPNSLAIKDLKGAVVLTITLPDYSLTVNSN